MKLVGNDIQVVAVLVVARGEDTTIELDLPPTLNDQCFVASGKANRPAPATCFQSHIALEQDDLAGSAPRTLEGAGTQRVDLGGSYRLSRNLDVTAGVRIKQDRDRLGPLTDGIEDDQAVYVGTQIRF